MCTQAEYCSKHTRVCAVLVGVQCEGHAVHKFVVCITAVLDLDPVGVCDGGAERHQSEALAHSRRGHRQGHADLTTHANQREQTFSLIQTHTRAA